MAFEKIKIAYLKQKLLLEEKKKDKRDALRIKKDKLQKEKQNLKVLESELIKRIKKEKTRHLTDSDKKRIKAQKVFYAKRKSEIAEGSKAITREAKDFTVFIGQKMVEAEKTKVQSIKKIQKKKSVKKKKQNNSRKNMNRKITKKLDSFSFR